MGSCNDGATHAATKRAILPAHGAGCWRLNRDRDGGWALPPSYGSKDKDPARYEAIGESDRFTLKFFKP